MNTKNFLVTGGRSPVALHVSRMLVEDGHTVYMAESDPYHLSKTSKVVTKNFVVPKPNENHNAYIQALIDICRKHSINVIIPTCEELFHLAKGKEAFEQHHISVFCDDLEKLRLLHNKFTFNRYLKKQGYIQPETMEFTSLDSLKSFLTRSTEKKFVLKAVYSRFASGVYFINPHQELPTIHISEDNPWILQEYVKGNQYCSYSIAIEGKLVAHTCYPTIYTAGLGANVFFKHVNEPKVEQFVERLVRELNFTGQIAFDFIKDVHEDFYPIECNPRATSGLHLFDGNKTFCSVFSEKESGERLYPTGEQAFKLGLPMLLYGVSEGFLFSNPRSFLNDFIHSKDTIYSSKDRMPYLYQGVIFSVMMARKLKSRKSLTELTTTDIEWSGK